MREGCSLGPGISSNCVVLRVSESAEVTDGSCHRQAQLIHDRNTASHSVVVTRTQAPSTPDKVQMTWTKEKLIAEKYKNKEPGVSGFKDLFSLKP